MDCHLIAHRNIAERYLLGSLPPEQQLLYEQHFFECDGCFSELQRLRAIRAALQSAPAEVPKRRRGFGYFGRWWRWPAIATAAASVVGVALLLRQHETSMPPPSPGAAPLVEEKDAAASAVPGREVPDGDLAGAATPAAGQAAALEAEAPPAEERAMTIARLAAVQPPRYDPPVLRGMHDAASAAFREAMKAYSAGDYSAAVPGLQRASAANPSRPDIAFYLGAAELLAGRPEHARVQFERLLDMGETVFTEEAHFYRGKALLRLGRVGEASAAFGRVVAMDGPMRDAAGRLVAELQDLEPPPTP